MAFVFAQAGDTLKYIHTLYIIHLFICYKSQTCVNVLTKRLSFVSSECIIQRSLYHQRNKYTVFKQTEKLSIQIIQHIRNIPKFFELSWNVGFVCVGAFPRWEFVTLVSVLLLFGLEYSLECILYITSQCYEFAKNMAVNLWQKKKTMHRLGFTFSYNSKVVKI